MCAAGFWLGCSVLLADSGGLAPELLPQAAFRDAPVTFESLEQLALQNSPSLEIARQRIQGLEGKHLQAGLYPNPSIGYLGEEIGEEGRAGQQGLVFEQRIITGGKMGRKRAVVQSELSVAAQEYQLQQHRVISDVRVAAHQVVAAQRTLALAEQLVQLGEASQRAAEQLLAAQEVGRADLLQARIEANAAKLARERARQSLTGRWQQLVAQLGRPDLSPMPIEDTWERFENSPLSWHAALDRLLSESPEWRHAAAELELAQAEWASQCASRIPDVDVQGGVAYNFASGDTLSTFGVAVPLQLFDRNQGNIQQARAQLNAAHEELRRVRLDLHQRLAVTFHDYTEASAAVQRYRETILPDAREVFQLVNEGYRQGEFSYVQLLTVQKTYYQTHLDFVAALRDLQVNRTRIEGLLVSGGLNPPKR